MYELEIDDEDENDPSFAYVLPTDLRLGKDRIFVGDMSTVYGEDEFVVENMEAIIIHESSHIAIYKTTEHIPTVRKLDNIDNPDGGDVYPISRTLQ